MVFAAPPPILFLLEPEGTLSRCSFTLLPSPQGFLCYFFLPLVIRPSKYFISPLKTKLSSPTNCFERA